MPSGAHGHLGVGLACRIQVQCRERGHGPQEGPEGEGMGGVPHSRNLSLRSLWGSRWKCGTWAGQRHRGHRALDSG